ncbi:hypothetical protein H6P81_002155 [Aristolochia fimbriata]|uniref:Protein kinase domain-containing protein n=1 Tax=Aristolochia fimbriata TaxID=158543 RepID=A0AAV7FC78_ARIFI|nr:hypothetical protein H6P81_002155 [Aristolochia fimbriata]
MADSVEVILDFLRRNQFTRAEAALRGELLNRSDLNLSVQRPSGEERFLNDPPKVEKSSVVTVKQPGAVAPRSNEVSKELIIKEVECEATRNVTESKQKTSCSSEKNKADDLTGRLTSGSDNTISDLYSWNLNPGDDGTISHSLSELQISLHSNTESVALSERRNSIGGRNPGESHETKTDTVGDKRPLWTGSTSKPKTEMKSEKSLRKEHIEFDQSSKGSSGGVYSKDSLSDKQWPVNECTTQASSDLWKEGPIKTLFPFPMTNASMDYENVSGSVICQKVGKLNLDTSEASRPLLLGKPQPSLQQKNVVTLDLPPVTDNHKEEFPRLPPVKLKSEDKSVGIQWEEKVDRHGSGIKMSSTDNSFLIGSYLDVPIGQEINSSGGKKTGGSSWLSVSQGITEDASDLVSGFATIGDGLSESVDYPNEYWDSDEYDDDDDVGYMRQPIEDEAWFLAHEIDYPSDTEKGTGQGSVPDQQERAPTKEEDDQSFAEEDSYFSGEQYFQSKKIEQVGVAEDPMELTMGTMYGRGHGNDLISQYDGQLMDEEELNLMRAEPVWQGFVTQTNELIMLGNGRVLNECERPRPDDLCNEDDQHGSVRSIGVGISSDAAEIGSEVRESLVGESSEGDVEYFHDHDVSLRSIKHSENSNRIYPSKDKTKIAKTESNKYVMDHAKGTSLRLSYGDGGFSFPPPLSVGERTQQESSTGLWSHEQDADDCRDDLQGSEDMLATWRRKSNDSSPANSSRHENICDVGRAGKSTSSAASSPSNSSYTGRQLEMKKDEDDKASDVREEDTGIMLEDEEAAAVQEQVRQIKAQEEEFETFNLKIVHRKNRTGFEEDKNFHVVLNSVIAGRYHVTEYLGSAAFSKAIQAHDLHTGMDVCVKIIKNNKDFFDQSLDEIKLLKFVNKHDPADKYHILRLYDYFYYREHLLIVCELLKANLYEFHKFNRESGGEVYFTMPRLQSITIQCLEALQFLHGLGLIHCDLKPENILVKSYSRCEVKVIDLGSSCFETDHLCSYVQSRSYRAPEVILGLPYDKKIDIWSLGCILAELCTGNVLFQNDSPATLLARVIGIIGAIDQGMLAKGRDTYKYFTKNHMLYERNQDTNRLEYLIPKKTSLRHRLPMGDQGFIDFVSHLLEVNPGKRPSASEALKHPWLSFPYEPISS